MPFDRGDSFFPLFAVENEGLKNGDMEMENNTSIR